MKAEALRQIVANRWFAIIDLLLVAISGVAWVLIPELGIWFTLAAVLPWTLRLLAGKLPFQRTPFDWLIAIFLTTAWVGYWAAYDKTAAWIKVWLIVTSVLMYFALSAQPKRNMGPLSMISFFMGLGISIYFFLTHNFTGNPESIMTWWINHRPQVGWPAIHHGYISGLLVITNLFAFYWLWNVRKEAPGRFSIALKVLLILGLGTVVGAFILTMSRGIWAAAACGLGVWVLWRFLASDRFATKPRVRSLFPVFVLVYLCVIIAFVYLGPARAGGGVAQSDYGINSRAELFERSAYFLADYPITGGGLSSFPGLYSQYILSIPIFYFVNSYNMFLDVSIEQGLIGGLAFILIYFGSVWFVSWTIVKTQSDQIRFFSWLGLFALVVAIVHGLFYDYLYNGSGTMLLLFPVGVSMLGVMDLHHSENKVVQLADVLPGLSTSKVRTAVGILVVATFTILVLNINKLVSLWYANLGSVQMSKVELMHFPTNNWATTEIVPELETANASLHSALQYDPNNQTANYRLGMISMLRQDFRTASINLETAHKEAPNHRGIIKSLGYCYSWLGELDKAELLLERVSEAQNELDIYVWWWGAQGRHDLSVNAFQMASRLNAQTTQP
ncbi:MAG: O-antigen ligase family protein [Chloroflexota bacterium]